METSADSPLARWTTPECPFAVEYVPRVLDDIRLAVVDAFFSLPRGGAEIGGILLGRYEKGRVVITDSAPLECEHAFGPSFTLSETDVGRLGDLIAAARKNPKSTPVGWYHSHTRSEIFLSEADLEIHKRYFPEPWQVAVVLKPHTFLPTRAGFFFTARDGTMRTDASQQEIQLDPLPMRPLPSDDAAPAAEPKSSEPAPNGRVIDISRAAKPEPPPAPEAAPEEPAVEEPAPVPPPSFLSAEPVPSRRWVGPLAVLLGLAIGAAGYGTRQMWLPRITGAFHATSPVEQASVGLNTIDQNGQLQIRWDATAPEVRRSTGGMLLITDGQEPRTMMLDPAHLRAGSFTYARTADRVDVTLSLGEPNGQKLLEATSFAGKRPVPPAPAAAPAAPVASAVDDSLRKERDQLRAENASLKAALARQVENARRLEKYLEDDRKEHQRQRLQNQSLGSGK